MLVFFLNLILIIIFIPPSYIKPQIHQPVLNFFIPLHHYSKDFLPPLYHPPGLFFDNIEGNILSLTPPPTPPPPLNLQGGRGGGGRGEE
jgi:hypothetical protein